MFRFFKKSPPANPAPGAASPETAIPPVAPRQGWLSRLKAGLGKTASGIASVFGGARIDEALFEDLENALLMADTGVSATAYLIAQLRQRAKTAQAQTPNELRTLLAEVLTELLLPLVKLKVITLTSQLVQWKICTNVLNSVEKSDPLFV